MTPQERLETERAENLDRFIERCAKARALAEVLYIALQDSVHMTPEESARLVAHYGPFGF